MDRLNPTPDPGADGDGTDSHVNNVSNGNHRPDGKFAPGNKLGRGNPVARRSLELRQAILDATTPDHVKAVLRQMLVKAVRESDVQAARLYLEYTVGRPAQAVELSGPDGAPLGGDLSRLEAAVIGALAVFPEEVRFAVAGALKGAGDADRAE